MFETAEIGRKVAKKEYERQVPLLRQRLLQVQSGLRDADFPILVLFAGVDKAGKGETASLLNAWMDPRWISTRAFGAPSEEERERPPYWRYWRELPANQQIGIFLSAWYSPLLLDRVHEKSTPAEFEAEIENILALERTLADDGMLILKFWMHLKRQAQEKRLKKLEKDPLTSWRVSKQDFRNLELYDRFVEAGEHIIMRTSTGDAPWKIVEGGDLRFASLRVATLIAEAAERRFAERAAAPPAPPPEPAATDATPRLTVLDTLDMEKELSSGEYDKRLQKSQAKLNLLERHAREEGVSTILVFQGWDAAGKGGAIRRVTQALDARDYRVIPIAAPTDEERAHHYLWRFWRRLPRAGRLTIFDRSWYGRVLVERVEGFATEREWRRAYAEINDFESRLVAHGDVVLKFWLHITYEEQEKRFHAREETPWKRFKLTQEDWRNRSKWDEYRLAVHEMVERTSTHAAPWVLVEGNDKHYARVKVIESICDRMAARLEDG